ncbi:MAG TPA: EAL domain-containing protein [Leptolyngbyaceae cyanobacterium M33_DOE_097]|uniref:GGDEF domain-containing response regulator n=1 Tax=Oscillatoriales cyanobacterium SpSt-418 TaxID=2282169 RepID=A0A7C3KIH7_9CYAN|nr:EAL domain-containing protein [Leptolyngbyaceae cyanobacterium M33_DOE_097]
MTKILIIEDDLTTQKLLLKILQEEGFEAIAASKGQTGIQLARAHEPDIIICDVMMPEVNGYDVLNEIRSDTSTADIPFIFLTALSDHQDRRHGMEMGADDYLTKPIKRTELLNAISVRLAKRSAMTQPYIDEMRRAAQNLATMAYYDPLTHLPNRITFHHRLQACLERQPDSVVVLYLGFDELVPIPNFSDPTLIHQVIQAMAQQLARLFGQDGCIARVGERELCLFVQDVSGRSAIAEMTHQVLAVMQEPCSIDGHCLQVQTNIGLVVFPEHGNTASELLEKATIAMQYSKTQAPNQFQFYSDKAEQLLAEQQLIYNTLNYALERQQLCLYFQPQVHLITGRIIGAEAFLRWQHPELGLLNPQRFLDAAESTGMIVPIGDWVIQTACQQAALWRSLYQLPIRVAVNLSMRQFMQPNLAHKIVEIAERAGLPPEFLMLELKENTLTSNVEFATINLRQLEAAGVRVAVDNFGTGFSSLRQLRRLRVNLLKIDRSFVHQVMINEDDAAIAKAIVAMAHALQIKVVAEGVETEEQAQFLRQCGCYAMQGYLYSEPMPQANFQELLTSDRRLLTLSSKT